MMKHNEQYALIKREWYDKLPAEQQEKVDMRFIELSLIDMEEHLKSVESDKYMIYTDVSYAKEVSEWVRLVYPNACFFANDGVQFLCLNLAQMQMLRKEMHEKRVRFWDATNALSKFIYELDKQIEPLEVFKS